MEYSRGEVSTDSTGTPGGSALCQVRSGAHRVRQQGLHYPYMGLVWQLSAHAARTPGSRHLSALRQEENHKVRLNGVLPLSKSLGGGQPSLSEHVCIYL